MKIRMRIRLAALAVALFPWPALAIVYTGSPFTVADGNLNGVWSQVTVSGQQPMPMEIRVALNLSGGYNGDLYAYLSYGGRILPLLNRIGLSASDSFGSSGAGMDVIFRDDAAINIHAAGAGYISGGFRADGQLLDPLTNPANFNANGGSSTFAGTFAGLNPNGIWTLFISDVVMGGGPVIVNSWQVEVVPVPEPAPGLFLLIAVLLMATRKPWGKIVFSLKKHGSEA